MTVETSVGTPDPEEPKDHNWGILVGEMRGIEIVPEAQVGSLEYKTSFADDLGADSLSLIELNMAMEERCEVEIADEELVGLACIGDVLGLIACKQLGYEVLTPKVAG